MKAILRKMAVTGLMLAISIHILEAQDLITMRDYSTVKAYVSGITDSLVTYKRADLPDGPVFNTKTGEILSIGFPNGTMQYFNVRGEMVGSYEEAAAPAADYSADVSPYLPQTRQSNSARVEYSNKKLFVLDPAGRPLREIASSDMTDIEMYRKYAANSLLAKAGVWIWAGGLGITVVGMVGVLFTPEGNFTGGEVLALLLQGTLIPLAIGIPMDVIGTKHVKKIGQEYNSQNSPALSFGCQKHGVGLAISF